MSYFPYQNIFYRSSKNDAYELKYVQTVCDVYSNSAAIVAIFVAADVAGSVVADRVLKAREKHTRHVALQAATVYLVRTARVAVAPVVIESVIVFHVVVTVAIVAALASVTVFTYAVFAYAVSAVAVASAVNKIVTVVYIVFVADTVVTFSHIVRAF